MDYLTIRSEVLWEPTDDRKREANLTQFMRWLGEDTNLKFDRYHELWDWSVSDVERFWESIPEYFNVKFSSPYTSVLSSHRMPGAKWFTGSKLNYAEHSFANTNQDQPAIIFQSESGSNTEVGWNELQRITGAIANSLRRYGVGKGDIVAGYLPNVPEAIIAFLACASIGAIWSSCSPDFGASSAIDRFSQIEPKVLFATDGYKYAGKSFDRTPIVRSLLKSLPTLRLTIIIPNVGEAALPSDKDKTALWKDLLESPSALTFEQVPFEHPLWILFTSGTTGLPKPIVQGHGGILLEHLKALSFHADLKPSDRFFWYTTTGWMMWNFLVSGLLIGSTIVLYDGSPTYPNMNTLWRLVEKTKITTFGTSAAYLAACLKGGLEPRKTNDLSHLAAISSTGSPLSIEEFRWVYRHTTDDVWLSSVSGGTDLCTPIVGGCPLLPVRAGEIQCRYLGAKVLAFDDDAHPVADQVGELVLTEPMPSMPVFFWNDSDGSRYRGSYFEHFPGVWRHGDWIKIASDGSCIIYGRSDSTIKRHGVRIGTSEIYRIVERFSEIADSLVVDLEGLEGRSYMAIFAVPRDPTLFDDHLKIRIKERIRDDLSPRCVPDDIFAVDEIPRTLNGKKLEIPVKKVLMGVPLDKAVNIGSLGNPASMQFFVTLSNKLSRTHMPVCDG
jgi:acetoacetyl-CoA synthetase